MEGSISIINLGDISKPADTLINKISDAIGGIFKPYQIRRVAQAEAEADKISAISQIEISELQHRALHRLLIEEARKQNNMESITSKAFPMLTEESKPENIEDDWITNFFDKCRLISDDEMQTIWSQILAGEANSPGNFSKRTIDLLASMDKTDAQLFLKLCNFNINLGEFIPFIYDYENDIYQANGINFSVLNHLESIGLINFSPLPGSGYIRGVEKKEYINYFDEKLWIEFSKPNDNELMLGAVVLTQVGNQLALVCDPTPVKGFIDYLKEKWQEYGYKVYDKQPSENNT